jgi:hypothetical protein
MTSAPLTPPDRIIDTVQASNDYQLRLAREHGDVVVAMQFCATIQMRTPMRVLSRHRELHTDLNRPLPAIAQELWEGIWLPKTRSFKEMGLNLPEFSTTMASDIGQIPADGGDYLPFLLAVRAVVETDESPDQRAENLQALLAQPEYEAFVTANRGTKAIIDRFFPLFVSTLPKLTPAAREGITNKNMLTAESISRALDIELLAIDGIGPSKLEAIRQHCAATMTYRDAIRADYVIR